MKASKSRSRNVSANKRAANSNRRRFVGKDKHHFPIVGIGASAGGYEAVTKLIEKIPPRPGMAFVLIQHLDPTHESKLSDLLRRGTQLTVVEAKKSIKVEPNHLYVIPPNRVLVMRDGCLQSSPRIKGEMPPMPIDSFLRSLAENHGPDGIGVILSGNGGDGTLGLESVKGADGITFAQAPESAKFAAMPRSAIASGCVDFVLTPERIGRELVKLPKHPLVGDGKAEKVLPGQEMPKIHVLLRSQSGVDFSSYKQSTLNRRIQRRMVVHRIHKIGDYLKYLRAHPEEVEALAGDVLITVTRFFRDRRSLEVLRKKVFPRLLEGRQSGTPIRVWVPGCSSGEEVYSLAILLSEYLGKRVADFPLQIFGTDLSEAAVNKARAGVYRGNIAMDVSPQRLRRFFTATDDSFRIAKSIRDQCIFARQDLGADPPFSQLDLISCQNVLIYFGPELQRRVLPIFHYALRPQGFLVLGSAESLGGLGDLFTSLDAKHRIYVKRAGARRGDAPFSTRAARESTVARGFEPAAREPLLPTLEKVADRVMLQHCAPSGVVVDSKLQVLQFRGHTAPYVEHKAGVATLNLLKLAREELVIPLRTSIAKAFKAQAQVRKEIVWPRDKDHARHLRISIIPFQAPPAKESLLLITFEEGGPVELHARKPSRHAARLPLGKAASDKEVQRLRDELEVTRESLQAIIEEQGATNEELKSANEEGQSTNEELQSTNEELETAKEEMQSTNEELSTVNDELRHANLEAARVNNDLLNLLSSVHIPVVMVDSDLMVRRFTPTARKFFSLIPTDIGRSLADIKTNFDANHLERELRDVIENLQSKERQVRDREGRWFSLRIRPYRTKENHIDGAVIVLSDINEFKRSLELMGDMVWDPFLTLDGDLKILKANQAFYNHFKTRPEDTEGKFIFKLGNGQWDNPRLRKLLQQILPHSTEIRDFEITHDFPGLGPRKILLNARELEDSARGQPMILLAMRDVTGSGGAPGMGSGRGK